MSDRVIIIGLGGHASVLIEILRMRSVEIIGATEINDKVNRESMGGLVLLGTDDAISAYSCEDIKLVIGVGHAPRNDRRHRIFQRFKSAGYSFKEVIHPMAIVSQDTRIGEGVQIMAGAIANVGCDIGENTIINTNASIDHDCVVGANCHIAPGATICGNVKVGDRSFIGAGATVVNQRVVGRNCFVKANTLVSDDVADNCEIKCRYDREMTVIEL